MEKNLLYTSVRNILKFIKVGIMCWYFYTALPSRRAIEVECSWVVKSSSINSKMIIMETFVHRTLGGSHPNAIGILSEFRATTSAKSQTYRNSLCIWNFYLKACIPLRVYHRVLLTRLIITRRLKVFLHFTLCHQAR